MKEHYYHVTKAFHWFFHVRRVVVVHKSETLCLCVNPYYVAILSIRTIIQSIICTRTEILCFLCQSLLY